MNFVEGARGRASYRRGVDRGAARAPAPSRATRATWKGRVGVAEHLGSDTFLHVHVDGVGLQTVRTDGENDFPMATRSG